MEGGFIHVAITLVAIPASGFVFKYFVEKADENKKEAEMEWRSFVKGRFDELTKKITSVCESKTKEHDEMWERIYHHQHDVECSNSDCGRAKATSVGVGK